MMLLSNKDKILDLIKAGSNEPFQKMASEFLACAPTPEAIQKEANKYPHRWVQCMAMLRKASGYTETPSVVNNNIFTQINNASDAEIEVLLTQQTKELEKLGIIEGELVEPES